MKHTVTITRREQTPEGWIDEEAQVPARWEICDLCEGDGGYVNPAIDACGLSAEDFVSDPEFAESYRTGLYDVPCRECGGSGKILVPVDTEDYHQWTQERDVSRREAASDRRTRAMEDGDWEGYCGAGDPRW